MIVISSVLVGQVFLIFIFSALLVAATAAFLFLALEHPEDKISGIMAGLWFGMLGSGALAMVAQYMGWLMFV